MKENQTMVMTFFWEKQPSRLASWQMSSSPDVYHACDVYSPAGQRPESFFKHHPPATNEHTVVE